MIGDPACSVRFGFSPALAAPLASPYAGAHQQALALAPGVLAGALGLTVSLEEEPATPEAAATWPIRGEARLYDRLSAMPVEVVQGAPAPAAIGADGVAS